MLIAGTFNVGVTCGLLSMVQMYCVICHFLSLAITTVFEHRAGKSSDQNESLKSYYGLGCYDNRLSPYSGWKTLLL